jgi:hypothetical protein
MWWLRRAMDWISIDQMMDSAWKSVWNALVEPILRVISRFIPDRLKRATIDLERTRRCVAGLLIFLPLQPLIAGAVAGLFTARIPAVSTPWAIWCRVLLALLILERLRLCHAPSMGSQCDGNAWQVWSDRLKRQKMIDRWLRRSACGALLVSVICGGWTGLARYLFGGLIAVSLSLTPSAVDASGLALENSPIEHLLPFVASQSADATPQPMTRLEERQTLIAHHVAMMADGRLEGLFIYGRQGGLGKTTTVLRTLAGRRIKPILINSHVTLVGLYEILHQHREGKIIVFDDCDALFRALPQLGLLRSALYGEPRVVTFSSSKRPAGLPGKFEFRSRLIFCANVLPKGSPAFNAVLTRCAVLELSATNDEILETMRTIANRGFQTLTPAECGEAVDYLAEHAPSEGLSPRLLVPTWQRVLYARHSGINWKLLVEAHLTSLSQVSG